MGHWKFMAAILKMAATDPTDQYIYHIFFWDLDNKDKDTNINFLSILFAEIWDIENSWRPFWKWLPQPPQTNIIVTFGFLDPENIDIETIINFLSILFAEIWDIEHSCQPFWKWLPPPPQPKSGWGPVLKYLLMGHTKCVQNVILVSQNAQFGSKRGLSIRTNNTPLLFLQFLQPGPTRSLIPVSIPGYFSKLVPRYLTRVTVSNASPIICMNTRSEVFDTSDCFQCLPYYMYEHSFRGIWHEWLFPIPPLLYLWTPFATPQQYFHITVTIPFIEWNEMKPLFSPMQKRAAHWSSLIPSGMKWDSDFMKESDDNLSYFLAKDGD